MNIYFSPLILFRIRRTPHQFVLLTNSVAHQILLAIIPGQGSQDEDRLVEYLFERQGYNPLIRPVQNQSQQVMVDFGMALVQLISVVSATQ